MTMAWQKGKKRVNGGGWWSWNPNSWTLPSKNFLSYLHGGWICLNTTSSGKRCVRGLLCVVCRLFSGSRLDCASCWKFCWVECTACRDGKYMCHAECLPQITQRSDNTTIRIMDTIVLPVFFWAEVEQHISVGVSIVQIFLDILQTNPPK